MEIEKELTHEITTSFLALRPREKFILQNKQPLIVNSWNRIYKVALIPTPTVDSNIHSNHRSQAVICAEMYQTAVSDGPAWGWVHLEESTKEAIGFELESIGASENEWFWMILDTRTEGYRDIEFTEWSLSR